MGLEHLNYCCVIFHLPHTLLARLTNLPPQAAELFMADTKRSKGVTKCHDHQECQDEENICGYNSASILKHLLEPQDSC